MDSKALTRIKSLLNAEYTMRLLVRYFVEKGFRESFDVHICPSLLQDIGDRIPQLADRVEIEPSVEKVNQQEGTVQLYWNLFVLGTRRMFLGYTTHRSMSELMQPMGAQTQVQSGVTPRQIIRFIVRTLSDYDEVVQPSSSTIPRVPVTRPRIGPTYSGSYYEKKRPVL